MNTFGSKMEKKKKEQGMQPMFCKNCGHKIAAGGKFCPACGTAVSMPKQTTEGKAVKAGVSRKDSSVIKNSKVHKRSLKAYCAGIAGVMLLLIVGVVIFTRLTGSTQGTETDSTHGFDKEMYKNLPFTKKQVKELENIYEDAYTDEKKALDPYILAYANSYDEYGELKEEFRKLEGITEDLYQAVNDYDPNLKDVLTADAAYRYGDGPLSDYMIQQGVGAVLSDSESGKDLRAAIETLALGGLQYFMIWGMESEKDRAIRSDAMIPIAAEGDYAFVRSSGSIGGMLNQLEMNSGYTIADKALEERLTILEGENSLTFDDYWTEDEERLFNTYQISENYQGRKDALKEKKDEWDADIYQWKSEFLTQIGMEDVDNILRWENNLNEEDEEKEIRTYFDISDKKYESLKKKYESEDIYYIVEETQGADAMTEYEEYKEEQLQNTREILGQYVYSIMDKEGKVYCSFLVANSGLNATINADGMCSVWNGDMFDFNDYWSNEREQLAHVIMDKEGKILFENDMEETEGSAYCDVTPSGNVLKKTFLSDLEHGDYQILEFVKPDGTSKKLMEGGYITLKRKKSECTDYYEYSCGYEDDSDSNTSGVIDMTTGELLSEDEYEEKTSRESQDTEVDMKELGVEIEGNPKGFRLNDQYVMCDSKIYNESGEVVKELTQGRGVKDILYGDGRYWVVTLSGWYYVLDEDFEEILKPVEMPKDTGYLMTEYGLLVTESVESDSGKETQNYVCLYDENGESIRLFEAKNEVKVKGFMVNCESWMGNASTGGVNLNTKEQVLISTPEKPISLTLK